MTEQKIDSIELLRDHALETLAKLSRGEIDVPQAGVTGKLCENVISTIKAQMEYARMLDQEPEIPFMDGDQRRKPALLSSSTKSLPAPARK